MNNLKIKSIIIIIATIIGFSGISFAGGGGPQDPAPGCFEPTPEPKKGPVINGTYTVSKVLPSGLGGSPRYVVHLVLKKEGEVHLYQFLLDTMNTPLCDFTEEAIVANLALLPCEWEIGQDFGIDGYPVIKSLTIDTQDMCGTDEAMIRGSIQLKVVPIS